MTPVALAGPHLPGRSRVVAARKHDRGARLNWERLAGAFLHFTALQGEQRYRWRWLGGHRGVLGERNWDIAQALIAPHTPRQR